MAFKKELPRWLPSKTEAGAGGGGIFRGGSSPTSSSSSSSLGVLQLLLIRIPSFLIRRCTLLRLFLLMVATTFVSMNIFVKSRGYSSVLDYYHRVPVNVPLQMDILVPLYKRDDTLKVFGEQLGYAIRNYFNEEGGGHQDSQASSSSSSSLPVEGSAVAAAASAAEAARDVGGVDVGDLTTAVTTRIKRFRLLLTRYPDEGQDDETLQSLKQELSSLTMIPIEDIVIVKPTSGVDHDKFERAAAVNLLQRNACHLEQCLVARMDADMTILPVFFHNAIRAVYLQRTAYFPIVWSEYYPLSIQLVEEYLQQKQEEFFLNENENQTTTTTTIPSSSSSSSSSFKLDPLSEHRGYWRKYGTGMYCLSGLQAQQYQLAESFKGWGGEDGDYYTSVRKALTRHRVTRKNEPGLIHRWHAKFCLMGVDVHDNIQWKDCLAARMGQMGSELGVQLLREHLQENMPKEYQHQSIMF